jgi:hypothetical protein
MMVGDLAVAMMFFQAAAAMDFMGRKVLRGCESIESRCFGLDKFGSWRYF